MNEQNNTPNNDLPTWHRTVAYVALGGLAYFVTDRLVLRHTRKHIHQHLLEALEDLPLDPEPVDGSARTASGEGRPKRGSTQTPPAG